MKKYILELTEEQAVLVMNACEMLSRLHIGQYWIISENMLHFRDENYREKKTLADSILRCAGMVLNGIGSYDEPKGEKNTDCNRAWSVYEAIRYAKSWHDHPEGGPGVNFDKPINVLPAGEPLPKCLISEE